MWDLQTIKRINTPTEVAKARKLAKALNTDGSKKKKIRR